MKKRLKKKIPLRKKKTFDTDEVEVPEFQIEYLAPSELQLWGKNPRLNDEGAKKLAKLIRKNKKFIDPIVIDQDGIIRAGNTRYKAAKILNLKKVPCVRVNWESEGEAAMYAIANNKAHEFTGWDSDVLAEAFEHKEVMGFDMTEMSGFSEKELRGLKWAGDEEFMSGIDCSRRKLTGFVKIKCKFDDIDDVREKVEEFIETLKDKTLKVI